MNKDNAKDFLPLVQALAEGKTIQVDTSVNRVRPNWEDADYNIAFNGPLTDYRIKQEPFEVLVLIHREKNEVYHAKYADEKQKQSYLACGWELVTVVEKKS